MAPRAVGCSHQRHKAIWLRTPTKALMRAGCPAQRGRKTRCLSVKTNPPRPAGVNELPAQPEKRRPAKGRWGKAKALMANIDAHVIKFQCPQCGHDLEQSIGQLKSSERMDCPGCGIGINIDTDRLANAAEEIHRAAGKMPREITIKFYR
jgi:predicted RNA-binding Zn-ribbon protein involved in translation (DUF1610 family)